MNTTFWGVVIDGAALFAVFIFMPVANYVIKLREIDEKEWEVADDETYECQM